MITRNALYDFIQTVIDDADIDDALNGAEVFRNFRTSIDVAEKVVRVETTTGQFCVATEDKLKERNVRATIQCWVLPDVTQADDEQSAVDDATDVSFDMAQALFEAIEGDPTLNDKVCDVSFEGDDDLGFETGEANLGTVRRGVTYLDGLINQAS